MEWFEHLSATSDLRPSSSPTRCSRAASASATRTSALRDADYLADLETWFARRATGDRHAPGRPPMFTPFRLRELELHNRIVVSPMSMYSAVDGMPDDFHLVHYGARAQGGAALVVTEMTDVTPDGRITPGCAGIWNDEQAAAWKRIVDFVPRADTGEDRAPARPRRPERRDEARVGRRERAARRRQLAAARGLARCRWSPGNQVPRAMTRDDMDAVDAGSVRAARARRSRPASTWSSCTSRTATCCRASSRRVTNQRTDEYGGSLENRLRYPLEIFHAVRAVVPDGCRSRCASRRPTGRADGITGDDAVAIADAFAAAGADVIDVSAGQTSPAARPVYGRMFQTPFADQIRNEARVATMAVGNITEPDHVNSIVMAGRADLCCLARPHLADPNWTLRAAAELGYDGIALARPVPLGRRAAAPARRARGRDGGPRLMRAVGRRARGSGNRRAIAEALAAAGASLTLVGATAPLGAPSASATHEVCDVTDEAAVAQLAERVGEIDVLVNNAGAASRPHSRAPASSSGGA